MISEELKLYDEDEGTTTPIELSEVFTGTGTSFVKNDPINVDRVLGGWTRNHAQQIDNQIVGESIIISY